jgi:hypothetical protein
MNVMKKIILYAVTCVLLASSANATPGSKILQKFKETFPNAQNVKWVDDKAGYFVSFMQNESYNKVFYNTEGSFVYALKYYKGDGLPTSITMSLNKKYGDAKIIGVTEVTTQNNVVYDVKLSKEHKLYSLNVSSEGSVTKEEVYDDGTVN